jgi:hypothetical protein
MYYLFTRSVHGSPSSSILPNRPCRIVVVPLGRDPTYTTAETCQAVRPRPPGATPNLQYNLHQKGIQGPQWKTSTSFDAVKMLPELVRPQRKPSRRPRRWQMSAPSSRPSDARTPHEPRDPALARALKCAQAVLGGRFETVRLALRHSEFAGVSIQHAEALYCQMRRDPLLVDLAKEEEAARVARLVAAMEAEYGMERKSVVWQELQFERLLRHVREVRDLFSDEELVQWHYKFELACADDLRYYSYRFQYERVLVLKALAGDAYHNDQTSVYRAAVSIFGEKAAYCTRTISNAVRDGISQPLQVGRPPSCPPEVECKLFAFHCELRMHKTPLYRDMTIDYLMRLLSGTRASLAFAELDRNGEPIPCEHGGFKWDTEKLISWYHRRFVGDRKASGVSTANQKLLDGHRARWQTYDNMQPYYTTHVRTLATLGIAKYNLDFQAEEPEDFDEEGIPKEPIAFWCKGEEWRALSFDEMKADDATHGDGGNRKARTERTMICGYWDDGECIGQKNPTATMSIACGSSGAHEPLPLFVVLARKLFDKHILAHGPVVVIYNHRTGTIHRLGTTGTSNEKGSMNTEAACQYVDDAIVPYLDAHGGVTFDRQACMACDGASPHVSEDFLKKCRENHIALCFRTPRVSHLENFEDLRPGGFWILKNAKSEQGWYKIKQQAALRNFREKGSSAIGHKQMLELLNEPFRNAFGAQYIGLAWKMGGFGADGITMRPLWIQKKHEEAVRQAKHYALTRKEKKRAFQDTFGLSDEGYKWPEMKPPWEFKTPKSHVEDEQDDGSNPATHSMPQLHVELQMVRCPATSDVGLKLRRFHDEIQKLKHKDVASLQEILQDKLPEVKHKNKTQTVVRLAYLLAELYNEKPMQHGGRVVKHEFRAFPKLKGNKQYSAAWQAVFGRIGTEGEVFEDPEEETDGRQPDDNDDEDEEEVCEPEFGYGADTPMRQ